MVFGKASLELLLHERAPQVDADRLAVPAGPESLLGLGAELLHADLLAEVDPRMDLGRVHPGHPLTAVLEVHHEEMRLAALWQHDRAVAGDVGRAEVVPVSGEVARVLGPVD